MTSQIVVGERACYVIPSNVTLRRYYVTKSDRGKKWQKQLRNGKPLTGRGALMPAMTAMVSDA
ncbi:hypothetical protein BSU04_23855 [Caballeronia sordidicola]|uniref:Uncharacterized protein n=1 Tax=Caballeronia sordidicola TaxID=196367 RepID=A0A226WZ55_CABSO|nr:hypothetical protein BSU04_23855 [Caballeronia sordidicola]